jgi:hypothetical protein
VKHNFYKQSVGFVGGVLSPWQGHYYTGQYKRGTNTDIHHSSGIRTTIPLFELVKIFCALDRAAKLLFSNINIDSAMVSRTES